MVAISADGNTLAVSAEAEDSAATGVNGNQADNSVIQAGAVYVFTRSGTSWSQQAYVKASNPESGDYFGLGLALSGDGNTLAAGAYMEDSAAFGTNLALSADGNTLVVCGVEEDSAAIGIGGNQADNSATDSGAVYVFR